ncbi:hypothetical protein [Herbaspirillum rubrisubalbicans]|uniref:hypothetical protein n=1 Tax=Herbaspirillum rubrisubalbicans TaxID=80842 RepID=UPI0012E952CF|nr:hypothetical protein [Herbaspirillum rubrisubalbicans]
MQKLHNLIFQLSMYRDTVHLRRVFAKQGFLFGERNRAGVKENEMPSGQDNFLWTAGK